MYKNNKTRVMKPLQFHNESVGIIQPINQHQVHKVVAEDKKVKMKDVFGQQSCPKGKSAPKPKPKRKPKSSGTTRQGKK